MVDIEIRLEILFPGITLGGDLGPEVDCVVGEDGILEWGRPEPEPTREVLLEVTDEDVETIKLQLYRSGLTCSLLQLKKALNVSGKRGQVNSEMANADQNTKDAWDCASIVKRLDPMVVAFGDKLGMNEIEMDEFIIMAETL